MLHHGHCTFTGIDGLGATVFDVDKFLDRAKAAAHVDTDYKLAVKVLGYSQQSTVTNWRSGRSVPDERAIVKLCQLTGDDAVRVAVELQARRSANDDAAALWRQVAQRLATVAAIPVLALLFLALSPEDARAAALASPFDSVTLLIMSTAIVRLLWRSAKLTVRAPRMAW